MKVRKKLGRTCPCYSGLAYRRCCRPLHQGEAAPSAEALMRSRFAAYKLGAADYILATTHPEGEHFEEDAEKWRLGVRRFCESTEFDGLEILDAGETFVHFHAVLRQGGADASFTEHSTFVKHDGHWKYLDGESQ
ncbi:MAG: zinc chelation protein SecC [Deltaproteobacteria bacterium]|nr:zinc chelation protein SecC [Deltaproteobacteria bacterium]